MNRAIVLGSGAAGLAAAIRLKRKGISDVLLITDGLRCGTSINTGSDKQTYYKLNLYGEDADSPLALARTLSAGGAMHGDLALIEAAYSPSCFLHLTNIGVPFPTDRYGQFIGYKTDHDPARRATSCGPYTSKWMCESLIAEVHRLGITILEGHHIVRLLICNGRCYGALTLLSDGSFETHIAEATIFAVGGPGTLYASSVYPAGHCGAIGLALQAGTLAQNLPESQFGLASIKFRWNVSGTYMQAIPRFVSTDAQGGDAREFLPTALPKKGLAETLTFLKGYQWPFDAAKASTGSSQIDLLVHAETALAGRRVWLDFRTNPTGLANRSTPDTPDFSKISSEARDYLANSEALLPTPFDRLAKMNPAAIEHYRRHGIHLDCEMLEVAVCAQHNNGGLTGTLDYESPNIKNFFPIGEVNGSHGITRPGGSALNAGQVAAFRAAETIAARTPLSPTARRNFTKAAKILARTATTQIKNLLDGSRNYRTDLAEIQSRMTRCAAHIRPIENLLAEEKAAATLYRRILNEGYRTTAPTHALDTAHLALSSWAYLSAIRFQAEAGTGSRGSAIITRNGKSIPENKSFRKKILETRFDGRTMHHNFIPCRPIPTDAITAWFEKIWNEKFLR